MRQFDRLPITAFLTREPVTVLSSSAPMVGVRLVSGPFVELPPPHSSPPIEVQCISSGPLLGKVQRETLTVILLPADTSTKGWKLLSSLIVRIETTQEKAIASTWLEATQEYGVGVTEEAALTDLITSLGDYKESLQRHEGQLAEAARRELAILRRLIDRQLV